MTQELTWDPVLAERSRLERLARWLTRGQDSDDLVQDTMVAALGEPTKPNASGAWLRTVMRNAWRQRARAERRRRGREAEATAPEAATPLDRTLLLGELLEGLAVELAALPEPFRGTVRRRFFEGLSAADIARADGCPAATVRWRLHEGLPRLRERLDRRFGARGSWFQTLALVAIPTPKGSTTMTKTPMWLGSTLALGVAGVTAIRCGSSDDVPPEAAVHSEVANAGSSRRAYEHKLAAIRGAHERRAPLDPPPSQEDEIPEHRCEAFPAPLPDPGGAFDPSAYAGAPRGLDAVIETCLSPVRDRLGNRLDLALRIVGAEGVGAVVESIAIEGTGADAPGLATCFEQSLHRLELDDPGEGIATTLRIRVSPDDDGHLAGFRVIPGDDVDQDRAVVPVEGLPRRGADEATARVRLVVCSDFECPFCHRSDDTITRLLGEVPELAHYVMHFPLPSHETARILAHAAIAAHAQGRFWPMQAALWQIDDPSEPSLERLAARLGLDVDRFREDLRSPATAATLEAQIATCTAHGATATPTYFVNGRRIVGDRPIEQLRQVVEEELDRAPRG